MVMKRGRYPSPFIIGLILLFISVMFLLATNDVQAIEIVAYSEEGLVSEDWWLNVRVGGYVSRVFASVDGGSPIDLAEVTPGNFSTVLDTTMYTDGVHEVVVIAVGEGQDPPSDEIGITLDIDNTPPEIEVEWPIEAIVTRPFEVNVLFRDAHTEGAGAWVEVGSFGNTSFPLIRTDTGFSARIDILQLDNGTHVFRVIALDGAGNVGISESKQLTVRKLPDLVVEEFIFWHQDPQSSGEVYSMSYTIRNIGLDETGLFAVGLEVDGRLAVKELLNISLGVNDSYEGWLEWAPQDARTYNLSFVIDPDNDIEEIYEDNNVQTDRQTFFSGGTCGPAYMIIGIPLGTCLIISQRKLSVRYTK